MKNITVTIDDETHRAARIRAAELGTSISALVKEHLQALASDQGAPSVLREERMTYSVETAAPLAATPKGPDGQPYFVNGKWVWTRDGKPRQPGALRGKIQMADDFDEWPEGFLDSFEAWEHD